MEGKYSGNDIVAPFVLKTYEMVDDPLTDSFITWGTANNSFVVLDSLHFSHSLLPAYFKHNNFSSFVRQLNTYGFKKVDPDRWEFANEWFLRGQYHLLRNIVRRKFPNSNSNSNSTTPNAADDDDDDHQLLTEIATLRKEQTALQHQLDSMKKRLETTEKRPHQMMAFLHKVVDDPEILPRIMIHRHPSPTPPPVLPHKKIKRLILSSSSSSTTTTSFDADDPNPRAAQQLLSTPLPPLAGDQIKYFTEMTVEDTHPPPPYPFSLFGCGF